MSTGLFGTSESFVPLRGATVRDDSEIQVAFTKAVIKDAPRVDADGHLDADDEAGLYRYYEIEDTGGGDERVGEGQDTSGPNTDDAMTRSEERLDVGTEKVATGRARLRKYVVTENVTTTVPSSARRSASSASRSRTPTATRRWPGASSPRRSTRSPSRRSASW